ncbi:hypothetical protein KHA90_00330 [Flavobacterium psychroterrae]|uniref:Class I SAM-dependent methyltransferase n=1 Tax=Flavobacterium psychroterrae TaxID=2133767 RepID=A0ABS5P599_9FLAO|nr:hypothetical protein [Flavobacterium psychroterrae]MBS7229457.1 hypothetical protein [Flavobacterium psychroterrae]
MYKQELTVIVQSIIASNTVDEHVKSAKELSDFYSKISSVEHSVSNETLVKGGIALSSSGAADCVDDYLRTVFFIKGIYKALTQLCNHFPERSVNILYAGCGPYATLILPLLPLFDKSRINALLLDINAASIASVRNLLSVTGLDEYQLQLIETDATTYTKPNDFTIDLAISETMHYALTSEPQVAITQNIVSQLPPHGILIPEEITIDLAYTFFDHEPALKNAKQEVKGHKQMQPYPHHVFVDRLFTINKELFSSIIHNSKIESKFYDLPANFENHPDICIFTKIKIFNNIELKTAESYITNPYCVVSLYSINDYSGIQLMYDFSEIPKWSYNLKN